MAKFFKTVYHGYWGYHLLFFILLLITLILLTTLVIFYTNVGKVQFVVSSLTLRIFLIEKGLGVDGWRLHVMIVPLGF